MRTKYAPVFAIALVFGWSVADPGEPGFGGTALARPKSHPHRKAEKNHHRIVRKKHPDKSVVKHHAPPVPPLKQTLIAQAASPSSLPSLDLYIPPAPAAPFFPPELLPLTRDQQMERLRVGLERLAKTIAASEDYREKLKLGLESRARAMNAGGI